MFRTGLAIATLGLVWTVWPAPGERAYYSAYRYGGSRYHNGPRVAIDLGHWNQAPADSRFFGLDGLLTWDGYRVTRSKQYLVPEYLKDIRLLVIGNAMPYPAGFGRFAKAVGLAGRTVFAPDEVDAVRDWVRTGGSLLLEANIPASGKAAAPLAAALGFAFHDCPAPVFLPEAKGRVNAGGVLDSVTVLANGWIEAASTASPLLTAPSSATCAAGKPLALGLEFGRGRVVALAVQLERNEDLIRRTGVDPRIAGNRQFVLDIMHWLSRAGN
jgi:hypothetical protein